MEKIAFVMTEHKVLILAGGSYISQQIINLVLLQGQPYINGVIGILTCIYLLKKIATKSIKTENV